MLENIKQTPRYWKKARQELYAKLENLGPFTFFFTLSCAGETGIVSGTAAMDVGDFKAHWSEFYPKDAIDWYIQPYPVCLIMGQTSYTVPVMPSG